MIKILGRHDAQVLRDIIFNQYRGEEDPMKRQWSGLLSHLENMKADIKGGKPCIRCMCMLLAPQYALGGPAFSVGSSPIHPFTYSF